MKKIPRIVYKTYNSTFITINDWTYSIRLNHIIDRLSIPKGHRTDGASIPRALWSIFSPFDPSYLEEATIHDYLCNLGHYDRADDWFNQLLKENEMVNKWKRISFMIGVRATHKIRYKSSDYYTGAKKRWIFN